MLQSMTKDSKIYLENFLKDRILPSINEGFIMKWNKIK